MLVAMTYSIELFACVVLGLCVGHFVFNTKSAVGESIDPCCASQQPAATTSNGTFDNHIVLSRTPCDPEIDLDSDHEELCQNTEQASVVSNCCESSKYQKSDAEQNGFGNPPPYEA